MRRLPGRGTKRRIVPTRADVALFVVVLVVAVVSVPVGSLLAGPANTRSARVEGPHGLTILSLDEDTCVRVEGACGELLVEVCDGSVRVVSSDCPERRCVSSGAVSSAGECIVCVPNAVTVTVGGERGHDLDAVVR